MSMFLKTEQENLIGVVVIDRRYSQGLSLVVVGGDTRWYGTGKQEGSGNVLAHAVTRAIGLIARKRRFSRICVNLPFSLHLDRSN